jgi:hypothetical protein
MRILPGAPQEFANETPTTAHLSQFLVSNPAFLPQVFTAFDEEISAFSSLLARRNMYTGPLALRPESQRNGYKIVGNRKVMWPVKGFSERKIRFVKDAEVVNASYPGQYQTIIYVYTDNNWASPKDVLGLADDNRSQIYFAEDRLPEEVEQGVWRYRAKVNTNDPSDYIDPTLLKAGMEANILYNQYEEMSQTAYEKYTFDEMAYAYMTIQRFKWSISGSADQYVPNAVWMEHNKVNMWATKAEMEMMKRAARYRENQLMFGKGTVSADGKIIMKTFEGFDVCGGDGIMNQGDGAWRLPYNELTMKQLDTLMSNMAVYNSSWGTEVAVICGQNFRSTFNSLMRSVAGVDPRIVEIEGQGKGINMDYDFYKYNGIKFIPTVVPWFDSPMVASRVGADGIRTSSKRAIFCSLGNVRTNEPAIELLALGNRSWLEGEINGINKGGDMANSVDGRSHHALFETGVALKDLNGIAEMYCPII